MTKCSIKKFFLEKLIGSKCLYDEECYGTNTVCREFRCSCPTNFEEFDIDEKKTICRLGKIIALLTPLVNLI